MAIEGQSAEVTFLIEEYKNIAATHDKLRDVVAHLFKYFLVLSAFPFTVAGIMFHNGGFDLFSAPEGLYWLFLVVGIGHLFLALTLVDARLGQYRYARTVNAIRKYFADHAPGLTDYLYLPTRVDIPSWENLGYIGYQVGFMNFVGALFVGYGVSGLGGHRTALRLVLFLVAFGAYLVLYAILRRQLLKRYQQHKGIK